MKYLSLFSGIEAASVAWLPLGWACVGHAEVEPFPCAVLAHHYPGTPNLGDVTKITEAQVKALGPVNLVVGGFPCQDLSVAGKRKGLKNDDGSTTRSGLFFDGLRIANWSGAEWVVVENVPGLFSSNAGRDFAAVVGALAGSEFDVPGNGWRNAGVAFGPLGLVEWVTLDAQYVRVESHPRAVPQRRRRVFIVRHSGDWRGRPPLFFERESMQGNPAPRREVGQSVTGTFAARTQGGGGFGTDFDCDVGLFSAYGGNNTGGAIEVATARQAHGGPHGRLDFGSETFLVKHSLKPDGFEFSENGTGRGTPLVPFGIDGGQVGFALRSNASHSGDKGDGGMNTTLAIAFDCKASGQNGFGVGEIASTMRGMGHTDSHQNGGGHQAVMSLMQVRRLTPLECERLMGFPENFTLVPYRKKPATDGPRYKALGNSMAVNVISWLGHRIDMVERMTSLQLMEVA